MEFDGIKIVVDEKLGPDEWRLYPPGRFVQELPAGILPTEFIMVPIVEMLPRERQAYLARLRLNGKLRWEPL